MEALITLEQMDDILGSRTLFDYTLTQSTENNALYLDVDFEFDEGGNPNDDCDYVQSELSGLGYKLVDICCENGHVKGTLIQGPPTLKQKIKVYEGFLHAINAAQTAMNNERMMELISLADNWSYAHRRGNGELTEVEQNKLINDAFERMAKFIHADLS